MRYIDSRKKIIDFEVEIRRTLPNVTDKDADEA